MLGRGARLLRPEEAEVQYEARRRGEPWLTSEEARALSFLEGRMLGVRVSAAVSQDAGLTAEEQEHVADAVREEMFAHVERIYAGLIPAGRFFEVWPQISTRVAQRCARWLGNDRVERLASALTNYFGDAPPGR